MLVQWQRGVRRWCLRRGERLDRVVVRGQGGEPGFGYPAQQRRIASIEDGTESVQHFWVRVAAHRKHSLRETGVQADHVTWLDHDAVGGHDLRQRVEADES